MTELLTAAQMRAIEQAAIASGEVTGLELMERAGQGVVDAIFEEWPELRRVGETHRAVVLCGPGNNGGDGFVVARLLKEAGWEVAVFLYGDAEKLPPDAKVNYERWGELGEVASIKSFHPSGEDYALAVDAVFGIGLSRALPTEVSDALYLSRAAKHTLAVDVSSGVCADSGRCLTSLKADNEQHVICGELCVTFHARKLGHLLSTSPQMTKSLRVIDIGLDRRAALRHLGFLPSKDGKRKADKSRIVKKPYWDSFTAEFLSGQSILDKESDTHKYSHGHGLILSGGVGKGGAARFAARGAIRIGAGAVTLGAPPAALIENAAQLNAVMLTAIKDADALTETLQDTRINALCIGPGLGLSEKGAALVEASLMSNRPITLDADALTHLSQDQTLFAKLHKNCILTPHAGEFARLFPDIAEQLNAPALKGPAYSKVDATRDAAERAGCTVLFKGPDTVIADPKGRCSINASVYERSAPWLATAGSGDVLAGFITGLLARGFQPMQAAETAAWLHTECALNFGPGLIAEDLPEQLPHVFRKLGL